MLHGSERETQRRNDYIRTELMDMNIRLSEVEARLKSTLRQLDEILEREGVDVPDAGQADGQATGVDGTGGLRFG